jgi:hypothetical protein
VEAGRALLASHDRATPLGCARLRSWCGWTEASVMAGTIPAFSKFRSINPPNGGRRSGPGRPIVLKQGGLTSTTPIREDFLMLTKSKQSEMLRHHLLDL